MYPHLRDRIPAVEEQQNQVAKTEYYGYQIATGGFSTVSKADPYSEKDWNGWWESAEASVKNIVRLKARVIDDWSVGVVRKYIESMISNPS